MMCKRWLALFLVPCALYGLEGKVKNNTYAAETFSIDVPRMSYHTSTNDRIDGNLHEVCFQGLAGDYVRYEIVNLEGKKEFLQKAGCEKLFDSCVRSLHQEAKVLHNESCDDGYIGILQTGNDVKGFLVFVDRERLVIISTHLPGMMEKVWKNFPEGVRTERRISFLLDRLKASKERYHS